MTTNIETKNTEAQTFESPTFESLGIPPTILTALTRIEYTTPTPIQAQAIPFALKGRDILGTAQTGTGKTAAFAIPMLAHLLNNTASTALVVAPTRELATQIMQAISQMTDKEWRIRSALLIGGEAMGRQYHALEQNPRIIIGTPGRINDHLNRRSLNLSRTDFLVLDETDRMLDMGFGVQIDKILKHMPQQRQTLLFSATLPPYITKMADKYLRQPERVAVGSTTAPIAKIVQETVNIPHPEKYAALTVELEKRGGSVIVFVKTKRNADRLAHRLDREKFSVDAIHGDLRQNRRDKVIRNFRSGEIRILVATDVAARGLDIPHIAHVINYDLPQCPEDFIHRIGRTGRNGAEGQSLSFISPEDGEKWSAIQRLLNPGERRPASEGGGERSFNKGRRKHGRKPEWTGPRRHRRNGPRPEAVPNEGRYHRGDAPPPRNESRQENRHEQQPRENRDSWGNRDRSDGKPEGIYKPRREGYQGKKRFDHSNKDRSDQPARNNEYRGENRYEKKERSFERPRHGNDGQKRNEHRNDRYKGHGSRDRKPDGDSRPQRERSDLPSYGRDSRPKDAGDKPVFRKGKFKPRGGKPFQRPNREAA